MQDRGPQGHWIGARLCHPGHIPHSGNNRMVEVFHESTKTFQYNQNVAQVSPYSASSFVPKGVFAQWGHHCIDDLDHRPKNRMLPKPTACAGLKVETEKWTLKTQNTTKSTCSPNFPTLTWGVLLTRMSRTGPRKTGRECMDLHAPRLPGRGGGSSHFLIFQALLP